ncbi:triphosphoribosyl-dephospho-CoA synthase [Ancylobacter amanitiformis]|uniref:Triphosphoribosyl-dephospho-CoA synthase n=1 Tax=Ancylobacter amanitiformis TaxID=217069 RepID=A0ABU0LM55_9HYPH|nr:triphosphoribosyl-dephospho-CoA synthase [Ancylobacter amanitiformis]MDQ0509781.1 triphosphoribosyl-dephospho-CoA synthase [Ancylobacter amanitiformis]
MTPDAIARAFRAACMAELEALKPGNVHRFSAGHGMEVAHFERAAAAAAPCIAARGARVGARIEAAVAASLKVTGLNTNLGILLLCAPLAAAAEAAGALRAELAAVLHGLDGDDAQAAFRAIAAANPGGLGRVDVHDVATPARIGLVEAMALAAGRDRIARQYARGFEDVFELGLPRLAAFAEAEPQARTEAVYLAYLSAFPDSHIARKFGTAVAEEVRSEAERVAGTVDLRAPAAMRHPPLLAFDLSLKERGLNPGTSADLTVATLFAAALSSRPVDA